MKMARMKIIKSVWMRSIFFGLCILLAASGCSNVRHDAGATAMDKSSVAAVSSALAPSPSAPRHAWPQLKALYDYDAARPLEAKVVKKTSDAVAVTRRLTLRGARGATVPLYVMLPAAASAQQKAPGVVLLHGKGGSIEDMVVAAQYLAAQGYASLIPEIVGHGARRTADSPSLFGGKPGPLRDGLIESIQDIRRALDYFVAQPEVDARRIGLMGVSLGAIMGSITTAVEPRIVTCVLVVGGADWRVMLAQSQEPDARRRREQSGAPTAKELALLDDVDPKNFAGHIAPRPALLINGRKDDIVPGDAARALFAAAKEPKKQIWLDSDHFLPPTEVATLLLDWLDTHLKVAPRKLSARHFPDATTPSITPAARAVL